MNAVAPVLFTVGGVILATGNADGLNWVAAGSIVSIVAGVLFAWIALVEIRRSGDRWFAAAIAGEKPVETGLTLDFLGDGVWKATVYADTPESDRDPTQIDQTEKEVRPGDRLPIVMTSGGGWNAVFSR